MKLVINQFSYISGSVGSTGSRGDTAAVTSSALFSASTSFFPSPSPRPPPKRMLPQPSLPISQPVKSAKYAEVNSQGKMIKLSN